MDTPRNPDTIIRELNDLSRLSENTHATLQQFPDDRLLQLALRQDEHRKRSLMKELHQSLTAYLHEVA
jgi:hypothetical protein